MRWCRQSMLSNAKNVSNCLWVLVPTQTLESRWRRTSWERLCSSDLVSYKDWICCFHMKIVNHITNTSKLYHCEDCFYLLPIVKMHHNVLITSSSTFFSKSVMNNREMNIHIHMIKGHIQEYPWNKCIRSGIAWKTGIYIYILTDMVKSTFKEKFTHSFFIHSSSHSFLSNIDWANTCQALLQMIDMC